MPRYNCNTAKVDVKYQSIKALDTTLCDNGCQ